MGPAESIEDDRVTAAIRGGATRRELLSLLALTGAGLLLPKGAALAADAPKRGGRIRVAGYSSSTADTLDPAKASLSTDYVRCNMFYNGLFAFDAEMTPLPALAESVSDDDATVWTVKLRKGVVFHDGKALEPADVVFSLNRHKDPAVGSKAAALAKQIKDVKAGGPGEVVITLESPNADLPSILATQHFLIVQDGTTDFSKGNGTGPYKCKEFSPGVRSIGVRNDNYWKPGLPYLDEVEYFTIADESARVNALLAGDVQVISEVNARSTKLITSTPGFELFVSKNGDFTDLIVQLDAPVTGSEDFAMAMKLLQDREQLLKSVFRGYGVIGNDQPIPPFDRFYNADLPQRAFDPDKAKFHLKKAGLENATVQLFTSPAPSYGPEFALLMQQSAKKAGLTIDVQRVPADGYWSSYWLKKPLVIGNINPRPTPDVMFSLFYKSDAAWNESHWHDPKFDQLLLAARRETDFAKRKRMYGDMQAMIHDSAGVGIPAFKSSIDAHVSALKGLKSIPTGELGGWTFAEYVWLDA
ncbi:ABC transporter substrate-binding protein [Lichenibacterium dinghuense]|uniref:ABC transporter substrate-binding protein n=1 Tax=Lichenibacterium dinghuense TaxID=2895977 RepID=UPI001F478A62|nr:ABC transporter substrate-binding protein [Lichenibacterium sp. 6Y81]